MLSKLGSPHLESRCLQNGQHKLVIVHARSPGGHWHQGMVCQARNGVDLQEHRLGGVSIPEEIDSRPTLTATCLKGLHRPSLKMRQTLRRETCGTVVARLVSKILALVVVLAARRLNLNDRQCLNRSGRAAAQQPNGELASCHKSLCHDHLVVLQGQSHRRR